MKRLAAVVFSTLILITFLLGRSLLERITEGPEQTQSLFGCSTYDTHGNLLKGCWSEKDQVWYLFVTSDQPVSEAVLHYVGEVQHVSSGMLHAQEGIVTGAFSQSGDRLELQLSDGRTQSVVLLQSTLPSVHIRLGKTTLERIHLDKSEKYQGNSIYLMDPGGEYDLTVEGTMEIKGRGNSTWTLCEKKAYQIEFREETSLMGMGEAKKWVLMANASDDSMLRTKLIYDMAENLDMAFVPGMEFVDLWIDGEYRGLFLVGEKVELGSSRLNLTSNYGALFEHDDLFYTEEDYWFRSDTMGRYFVLKEIVEENGQIITSAMDSFKGSVEELINYLYATPSRQITLEDLSARIDVDSFAKYYLVNEYVLNNDSIVTSFYWYQDGPEDVLHLGPIWDYDTSMGNDGRAYSTFSVREHILFRYLLAIPAFYERTLELWEEYEPYFAALPENARQLKAEVDASAEMNYKRWDVLGKPNPKGGQDFSPTYEEAVSTLCSWLEGRQTAFAVEKIVVVNGTVSDDCSVMDICFADDMPHDSVRFAVWCMESEQRKVFWYDAVQDASGNWTAQVDLARHAGAGMYGIDAYADGSAFPASFGFSYVKEAKPPVYRIRTKTAAGGSEMTITLEDSDRCRRISFAVWSEEGGQDDLEWYPAQRNLLGLWKAQVPLERHQTDGIYNVHAYSETDAGWELVDYLTIEAADIPGQTQGSRRDAAFSVIVLIACLIIVNYRRNKRRN